MSLLQKASIITTPTAYAEDYLYSIKPAYALGSELVVNGDGSSTTGWSVAYANTTLSINNNNLRATANTSGAYGLSQSLSLDTSKKYIITADINVDNASGGTANFRIATNANLSANVTTLSTATGTITTTFTPTAPTMYIGIVDTANSSSNYVEINNISVKKITDADFDFDRNSTGTRVNEDYLIEDVPYNLVTYSEDFSNSGWTKENITILSNNIISPDGTLNGDKISETATNTYHALSESINITSGNYTISVFAKLDERQYMLIRSNLSGSNVNTTFDLSNGLVTYNGHTSASIESAGNGWFRCSVTSNSSVTSVNTAFLPSGIDITNNNLPTYLGVVGSGLYIYGAQIVKGDQPKDYLKTTDRLDIPRIDYTNGEPSILLEPQRTNQSLHSNDISQLSTITSASATITTTGNYATSPDGTNTATRIVATTTGSEYAVVTSTAASSTSGNYVGSVWLKSNNGQTQNVATYTRNATVSYVTIYPYWQRYEVGGTTATNFFNIGSRVSVGSDASVDFLAWGMQIEHGDYATSLIHTSGSAVTRSADSANNAGNSDLINSTEGVLYAEIASLADDGTSRRISLSDGSISNRVSIEVDETAKRLKLFIDGSVLQVDNIELNNFTKICGKYKANDYSLWVNGLELATLTTSSNVPSGLDRLNFDGGDGNNDFYGNAKMVAVFKEALTDLELEKLTGYNNHELYMNYYNRLSYLGLVEEYNVESDINNYIL